MGIKGTSKNPIWISYLFFQIGIDALVNLWVSMSVFVSK